MPDKFCTFRGTTNGTERGEKQNKTFKNDE
jgi:hypothetical protein